MKTRLHITLAALATLSAASSAGAYDLSGAWADDPGACKKLFVRKRGAVTFGDKSDIHGSGFIVDGNQIRGRFARCRITSRKEDGADINLLAACSTDVMLSNVQFSLKVKDNNTIMRQFPGIEGMRLQYSRCP